MTFNYINQDDIIREYGGKLKKSVNSALSPPLLCFIAISVLVLL